MLSRPLVQAAWSLLRSPYGGNIKAFYERLQQRIGKKKAIAATARKITEVFYAMVKSGTLYFWEQAPCRQSGCKAGPQNCGAPAFRRSCRLTLYTDYSKLFQKKKSTGLPAFNLDLPKGCKAMPLEDKAPRTSPLERGL